MNYSGMIFVQFFTSNEWIILSCFLVCFVIFLLRTEHSEYNVLVILEIYFSNSTGIASFCLLRSTAMWIFKTNFAKFVFLIRYDHWSFSSIVSAVSLWPYKDFLKCLAPTRGKIDPVSLNPLLAGKSFLKSPVSNEIMELKFFIPSRLQVLFFF